MSGAPWPAPTDTAVPVGLSLYCLPYGTWASGAAGVAPCARWPTFSCMDFAFDKCYRTHTGNGAASQSLRSGAPWPAPGWCRPPAREVPVGLSLHCLPYDTWTSGSA
eukprot:4728099-Pyramimonas_sp.AAC.1